MLESFSSNSIRLGRVLEDFNKSIHNIHTLACITLLFGFTCLLVGWGFFWHKITRGCDNFQYCKKGESFHHAKIDFGSLWAMFEFGINIYFNKLTSYQSENKRLRSFSNKCGTEAEIQIFLYQA